MGVGRTPSSSLRTRHASILSTSVCRTCECHSSPRLHTRRLPLHAVDQRRDTNTRGGVVRTRASPSPKGRADFSQNVALRSEAEAPFRVFRLFIYGALAVNAGLGGLIQFVHVVTGAIKGDVSFTHVLGNDEITGLFIDVGALAVLLKLYSVDSEARNKQMKRIERETKLSKLKVEILSLQKPRLLQLEQLQGFARIVVVAGSADYVREALSQAAELRDEIKERSICIIPLVTSGAPLPAEQYAQALDDPEIVLMPILTDQWKAWIADQMDEASVAEGSNVYVGLRMDGRVRASGLGFPPWPIFVAQLTPKEGIWGTEFMSGFDGRV